MHQQQQRLCQQHFDPCCQAPKPAKGRPIAKVSLEASIPVVCPVKSSDDRTTLMFKNLPNDYTRGMFCEMFDSAGFAGLFNFVYLPRDFKKSAGFGYAFVNFELHAGATAAMRSLRGFSRWEVPSRKILEVAWSSPHQGLTAHVERYRNSPIMHEAMPDDYKPILLKDGFRISFPAPTKRLRAPRASKDAATEK